MKKSIFLSLFLLFALSFNATISAQWVKLGERAVNFSMDRDEINVTVMKGTFKRLKFIVRKAPIYMKNVRVVYGNGESTNIRVRRSIAKGTESPVFDLPGKNRIIKKIVFNYRSIPTFKGRGLVEAFGKR